MEETALTTTAWIFMLASMGSVSVLTVYCFYRILTTPREHGTATSSGEHERGTPAEPGGGR